MGLCQKTECAPTWNKAMGIIGPSARRKIVEPAVEFGRKLVERQKQVGGGVAFTRKRQRAAERLAAAIHNTEAALNNSRSELTSARSFSGRCL